MPALGHNSERVGSTKKEKGAETVPRHSLAVREAMLVICRARGWQVDCKLAWLCLFVEAWFGFSAGLLSNWQRQDQKASPLFAGVRFPYVGNISELVGITKDGAEAVPGRALAACGAML